MPSKTEKEGHLRVDHGWPRKVLRNQKDLDDAHEADHGGDIKQVAYDVERPHNHPTGHWSPIQTTDVTYEQ